MKYCNLYERECNDGVCSAFQGEWENCYHRGYDMNKSDQELEEHKPEQPIVDLVPDAWKLCPVFKTDSNGVPKCEGGSRKARRTMGCRTPRI